MVNIGLWCQSPKSQTARANSLNNYFGDSHTERKKSYGGGEKAVSAPPVASRDQNASQPLGQEENVLVLMDYFRSEMIYGLVTEKALASSQPNKSLI